MNTIHLYQTGGGAFTTAPHLTVAEALDAYHSRALQAVDYPFLSPGAQNAVRDAMLGSVAEQRWGRRAGDDRPVIVSMEVV